MNSVAIVGNGPSSKGMGAEIDICDFVVRTGIFPISSEDAGKKMSAWCWHGSPITCPGRHPQPQGEYETWFSVNTKYRKLYPGFWKHAVEMAHGHGPIRALSDGSWTRMCNVTRLHPSTGIAAVAIAIEALYPQQIKLFGFDATKKTATGWGDATPTIPWHDPCGHDFVVEKQILSDLLTKNTWLGRPCHTELIWPAKPKEVT